MLITPTRWFSCCSLRLTHATKTTTSKNAQQMHVASALQGHIRQEKVCNAMSQLPQGATAQSTCGHSANVWKQCRYVYQACFANLPRWRSCRDAERCLGQSLPLCWLCSTYVSFVSWTMYAVAVARVGHVCSRVPRTLRSAIMMSKQSACFVMKPTTPMTGAKMYEHNWLG